MTRRLIVSGRSSAAVGTYFSLGHSTYVTSSPTSLCEKKDSALRLSLLSVYIPLRKSFLTLSDPYFPPSHVTHSLTSTGSPNPPKQKHSIVIIISIAVAGTAEAISTKFNTFSRVGGIIGTSVSASFLILLSIINAYIGYKLYTQLKILIATNTDEEKEFEINGAGCLFMLFKKLFRLIDRYVILSLGP